MSHTHIRRALIEVIASHRCTCNTLSGAVAVLFAVTMIGVGARHTVRLGLVAASSTLWIAGSRYDVAFRILPFTVWRIIADHRIFPDAEPLLAGVFLSAGVVVITGCVVLNCFRHAGARGRFRALFNGAFIRIGYADHRYPCLALIVHAFLDARAIFSIAAV